jgi:hypothetical protein
MATHELISTVTVGSGGASTITLNNIPQTYTDLAIYYSCRSTDSATRWNNMRLSFNGSASNGSWRYLAQYNNAMASSTGGQIEVWINFSGSETYTFSNSFVYIPNYTASTNKNIRIDTAAEGNAQDQILGWVAGLWSNSAAITSITVTPSSGNFAEFSKASIFGISKS